MNIKEWLNKAPSIHKAMPVLSFPGASLINVSVGELVKNGELQAQCMKAVADKYNLLASVSLMDLSVEAEAFGSPIRLCDDEVPTVTSAIVFEGDEIGALKAPTVGAARTGEYINAIKKAKELISDIPVFAGSIGPFSLAGRLMDMSEIMVMCYTEPELVHSVLRVVTDFLIQYNNAFKTAGANGIVMAEPAAGLLSPDLISEFSSPYVKEIISSIQTDEFGVIYHNCGNIIPLIDSILDTGAAAYHFGNAVDLAEVLKLIPEDTVVMGNVDPAGQFKNGTPETIKAATLDVLKKCSIYPNFVTSSGCDIPPAAPHENIEAFFETVTEFYK